MAKCRPEAISGTGSGFPYQVWDETDPQFRRMISQHSREVTAISAASDYLLVNPHAEVEVTSRFRMEWRTPQGSDCTPETIEPQPEPEPEPTPEPEPEPEPEPLTPAAPGRPHFSVVNGHVLVSWAPADRADRYYYSYGPDSPATWGGSTTDTSVTVEIEPGGEFCVIAENEHGRGEMACAVYAG